LPGYFREIALSKESFTIIDYPVIFENNPENYVLSGKPDSILSFTVSSGGLDLLTLRYFSSKIPVRIDLSDVRPRQDGDYFWASIPTFEFSGKMLAQLNLSEEHITVSPEYLNLRFEPMTGRKVKVIPRLNIGFEKQFMLSGSLKATPDSVLVLGQKEIVDNITFVDTRLTDLKNIAASQKVNVGLLIPENFPNVKLVPETVTVEIPVDQYTESTVEISLRVGDPATKIKTFPQKVKITFHVGLKDFSRVSDDMFMAQVNYNPNEPTSRLKVNLVRSPSFVNIVRIEPESVEFLILK